MLKIEVRNKNRELVDFTMQLGFGGKTVIVNLKDEAVAEVENLLIYNHGEKKFIQDQTGKSVIFRTMKDAKDYVKKSMLNLQIVPLTSVIEGVESLLKAYPKALIAILS